MQTPRVRLEQIIAPDMVITLNGKQKHYLCNVLRKKVNDNIILFNNIVSFESVIVAIDNFNISILTKSEIISDDTNKLKIHVYQGLCRSKKIELVTQKITELGASELTPIITDRTQVNEINEKKLHRLNEIATHACQQSGRNDVLKINPAIKINQINFNNNNLKLLLQPNTEKSLLNIQQNYNIDIFIGPEGGFSNTELGYMIKNNCTQISFGPRILRTETAALAICAAINALWGDCG